MRGTIHTLFLVIVSACLLSGCGGAGVPTGLDSLKQPELTLDSPAPAGVDAQLWAKLTAALGAALEQPGRDKSLSAAPDSEAARVNDFMLAQDAEQTPIASWTYRNPGDYNQNGSVGVDDLVPIAAAYGANPGWPNWSQALLADGNGDGEINLQDVTVLAQHFGNAITGYELAQAPTADGMWGTVATIPFSSSSLRESDHRRVFDYSLPQAVVGQYYRVRPVCTAAEGTTYGPDGNSVKYVGANPAWPQPKYNAEHTNRSPYAGPRSFDSWSMVSTGSLYDSNHSFALSIGNNLVYPTNGVMHCVSPDGSQLWEAQSGSLVSNLAVAADGTIFGIFDVDSSTTSKYALCAFSRNGEKLWQTSEQGKGVITLGDNRILLEDSYRVLSFTSAGILEWSVDQRASMRFSPALDATGTAYCVTPYELRAISADGQVLWQAVFNKPVQNSAAIRPDGVILVPVQDGLHAFSPAGDELWVAGSEEVTLVVVMPDNNCYIVAGGELGLVSPDGRFGSLAGNGLHGIKALIADAEGFLYCVAETETYWEYALYALQQDGVLLWSSDSELDWSRQSPQLAIDENGSLVATTLEACYRIRRANQTASPEYVLQASSATHPDQVDLSWLSVPAAVSYRVYRGGGALPIAETYETSVSDTGAIAPDNVLYSLGAIYTSNVEGYHSRPVFSSTTEVTSTDNGAGDWRMSGRDAQRSNCSHVSGPATSPTLDWSFTDPVIDTQNFAAPVSGAAGTLYLAGRQSGMLYAVDPDGKLRWRYKAGAHMQTPAVGTDGTIYASVLTELAPGPKVSGPPFGISELIAIAPSRYLHWRLANTANILYNFDGGLDGGLVIGPQDNLYWGAYDSTVWECAPDGEVLGKYGTPQEFPDLCSTTLDPDGLVYVSSLRNYDTVTLGYDSLRAFDSSRNEMWDFGWKLGEIGSLTNPPLLSTAGVLYGTGFGNTSYTYNGKATLLTGPSSSIAAPVAAFDCRIILDTGQELGYFMGKEYHQLAPKLDNYIAAMIADAAGRLYVTGDGYLSCYDPTGAQLWRVELPVAETTPRLSMGNLGQIYVAMDDRLLAYSAP